ncbi:ATP-binding protein [Streptomyces atroolivaceus]|uniref:ATP-binding protein n=1 Tax=Streptomyces atroolivaceus TaxID=66869 RepID=A0ABV9VIS3_STRAZ|nr:XRE family transcriptional regulator [Streptomyces atroolivaceus]
MNDGDMKMNREELAFGVLLRHLRLNADMTVKDLAEASGVSVRGIGDLERGRRAEPQRRTVAALASGLRLDERRCDELLAAARRGSPGSRDSVAVRTFPRGIDDFVGREEELASLITLLSERTDSAGTNLERHRPVLVTVSGPPGTGKTTLALHAAQESANSFPDGRMVLDLRGMDDTPASTAELMLSICKAFGVADQELATAGPEGHSALYRDFLSNKRCLLVLDNARDEAQVRELLPAHGRAVVMVTSRRMLTGLHGARRLVLGELAPCEAVAFLTAMIGTRRASAESSALEDLARQCGYLPLALRVAGSWLATRTSWTVRRLAERLAVVERRLDALVAGDMRVSSAFDLSYHQLTPDAARLFRRLALVPGPDAGPACAARLIGQDLPSAEAALGELIETGLLGTHGNRFKLHDLLRLYAHVRLEADEEPGEVEKVRDDLYRWLLETTVVAGRWFEPDHGGPPSDLRGLVDLSSADKARDWLQTQGVNWLTALRAAAEAGDHALVVDVAESLHWFSDQWIFWGHWPEVFGTAARSAKTLGDAVMEATQLNYCAWAVLICESRPAASLPLSARALSIALKAGDAAQQAWAHYYRAWACRNLNQPGEAARHCDHAADLFASTGDLHGSLQAHHARSVNLLEDGDAEAALASYQRTHAFLDEAGALVEPHIATTTRIGILSGTGRSLALLGRWDEAVRSVQDAVRVSHDLGNASVMSVHLVHLGRMLADAGRVTEAREAFLTCIELGSDADPRRVEESHAQVAQLDSAGNASVL